MKTDLVETAGGDALAMANIAEDDQNFVTCVHDSQLPGASRPASLSPTTYWKIR